LPLPEFNEDQRQKVTELAFKALDTIDDIDGEHVVGDAVLLVEYMTPDVAGTGSLTYVASFHTTTRVTVRRGIVEQARDELASFADDDN
jgi:hypothetical protein